MQDIKIIQNVKFELDYCLLLVELYVPLYSKLNISVYHLNGTKESDLYLNYLKQGKYLLKWYCGCLPKGEYYLRVDADQYVEQIKFHVEDNVPFDDVVFEQWFFEITPRKAV